MQSIRVSVTVTEATLTPDHAFVCETPTVDRQVIVGGHVDDGVETTISFFEGGPDAADAFRDFLPDSVDVETAEVTPTEDGFFRYTKQRLGERGETMFEAFHQESIVVVPPFEFLPDRTMRVTLVGTSEDLGAVIDGFPDGISVEVLRVGQPLGRPIGELTSRQREAVTVAWAVGYYDVPRTGGIDDVADELACAVSTASDLLRRAETRLVANALDVQR